MKKKGSFMRQLSIVVTLAGALLLAACAMGAYIVPIEEKIVDPNFQASTRRVLIVDTFQPNPEMTRSTNLAFVENMQRSLGACGIETSVLKLNRLTLNQEETRRNTIATFHPELIIWMTELEPAGFLYSSTITIHRVHIAAARPEGGTIFEVSNKLPKEGVQALGTRLAAATLRIGKGRVFGTC